MVVSSIPHIMELESERTGEDWQPLPQPLESSREAAARSVPTSRYG